MNENLLDIPWKISLKLLENEELKINYTEVKYNEKIIKHILHNKC